MSKIISISSLEARWGDEITMVVEDLPPSFLITLDGAYVTILSVVNMTVTWVVPRIPIGPRKLLIVDTTFQINYLTLLNGENITLLNGENITLV